VEEGVGEGAGEEGLEGGVHVARVPEVHETPPRQRLPGWRGLPSRLLVAPDHNDHKMGETFFGAGCHSHYNP